MVSWRIIIDDLRRCYKGEDLGEKGSSYRQWSAIMQRYSEYYPEELAYWQAVISQLPVYNTAKDIVKPMKTEISLDKQITQQLLHYSNQAYHTELNELLLVALAYALKVSQGGDIHGVTIEGHGRECWDSSIDLSQTVGWFTSLYPLKLMIQDTLASSIQFIKESIRQLPHKGIGYAALSADANNELSFSQLPPIIFNYLGQFDYSQGDWQLSFDSAGSSISPKNKDRSLLTINSAMWDGCLHFEITSYFDERVSSNFAKILYQQLAMVNQHCTTVIKNNQQCYTPSDFNDFFPFVTINKMLDVDPIFIFPPGNGDAESYYSNLGLSNKNWYYLIIIIIM